MFNAEQFPHMNLNINSEKDFNFSLKNSDYILNSTSFQKKQDISSMSEDLSEVLTTSSSTDLFNYTVMNSVIIKLTSIKKNHLLSINQQQNSSQQQKIVNSDQQLAKQKQFMLIIQS